MDEPSLEVEAQLSAAQARLLQAQIQWDALGTTLQHNLNIHITPVGEKALPEELRPAFRAKEELRKARTGLAAARKARDESRRAAARGPNTLQGMRRLKDALFRLQKVAEESPDNMNGLIAALSGARAVGAAPHEVCRYEKMLAELCDRQPFEVRVTTLTREIFLPVSGAQRLMELREKVAEKMGWAAKRTKLLRGGERVTRDCRSLFELGVTPETCDFTAVQVMDEVEESYEACVERSERLVADMRSSADVIGIVPAAPPAGVLEVWTRTLIRKAVSAGFVSALEAASLIQRVEDGELTDADARGEVRASARSASGIAEPLQDVDASCLKAAQGDAERISEIKTRWAPFIAERKRALVYSQMIGEDARSWTSVGDRTGQARAVPHGR